jgi:hypothetical protein
MSSSGSWSGAGSGFDAPPPPGPASDCGAWDDGSSPATQRTAPGKVRPRPGGMPFDSELDLCEIDDRDRPGATWTGRARELSRSHLVFRSRRMCYVGRRILVAVHLIDDRPVRLAGRVYLCEYDADGQYKVGIDLTPVPEQPPIQEWYARHGRA